MTDGILFGSDAYPIRFASGGSDVWLRAGALTGQPVEVLLAEALGQRHRQHRGRPTRRIRG